MKTHIPFLAAFLCAAGPAAATTLIQWTGPGSNGHYYCVTDTVSSWEQANLVAISLGGYLASVTSAEENDFLQSAFFPSVTEAFWIGLTDAAQEGTWVWTSGESVGYTNWGSGEPNDAASFFSPGEDYAAINWPFAAGLSAPRGTWNDVPNTGSTNGGTAEQPYRAIIEFAVPEPSSVMLSALVPVILVRRRRR